MQWHLILISALRGRNVFAGICFALYAAFIEPPFVRALIESLQQGSANTLAAGVIVAAMVFESLALTQKIPYTRERCDEPVMAIFPWMLHAALSLILLYTAAAAAGLPPGRINAAGMAVIFAVVIKELYFLFLLLGVSGPLKPRIPEAAADIPLFVFSCVAYSAVWKVVLETTPSAGAPALDLIAGTILFWLLYLPMILPATIEEVSQLYVKRDWLRFLLFIGIPAVGSQVHLIGAR